GSRSCTGQYSGRRAGKYHVDRHVARCGAGTMDNHSIGIPDNYSPICAEHNSTKYVSSDKRFTSKTIASCARKPIDANFL
ncbi:MAG: hypothetical protein JXM70_06225, partial [Pirellulales bacterium]|nr:hypothetical protein [Pirellulales bacterium]